MKITQILEAKYHQTPEIPIYISWATNYNGISAGPDTDKIGKSYEELEELYPWFDEWVYRVLEGQIGDELPSLTYDFICGDGDCGDQDDFQDAVRSLTDEEKEQLFDAARTIIDNDGRFKVSSIRLEYDHSST